MRNPGLRVLGGPTTYVHPRFEDIRRGDVDFDPEEEEGEGSDWVPFAGWNDRARNPGQPLRTKVGPAFKPGETPEDVIHGEVVTPEEQDAADHIINGDHESDQPSDNPDVEHARQDLHSDSANQTVHTLSDLLNGGSPQDVGGLDEAHDYLTSRRFTGVRINPKRGELMAQSPAGMQLMKREVNLPAVREQQGEEVKPTYKLVNKHGTFESHDSHRLVRAMVAFQLVNNAIEMQREKRERDRDKQLATTSGALGNLTQGFYNWLSKKRSKPSYVPSPHAIFEPGAGVEHGPKGAAGGYGGWVAPSHLAPDHWLEDPHPDVNVSYSPGHFMNHFIDPVLNKVVHPDKEVAGHTFTYGEAPATGHTIPIESRGFTKWVKPIHPQGREQLRKNPITEMPEPAGTIPTPATRAEPHDPPLSLGPSGPHFPDLPPRTSAVNDLCPVCASGYLEPYDSQFHECLNCGSLVKHVGFEKEAASRPKGGLGRGLKNIETPEATKSQAIMDIAHGGTQDPNKPDEPRPTAEYHPLRGEEMPEEYQEYQPPKRIVGAAEPEPITLDEHLGKFGFQPTHRAGDSRRAYVAPLPGTTGGYASLIERKPHPITGEDRGWTLRAVHVPPEEQYTQHGAPYEKSNIPLNRYMVSGPDYTKQFNQPLTDPGERMMPQVSDLASGFHPVHDTDFARAIADVGINGRDSQTYQDAVLTNPFVAARPSTPGPGKSQKELRGLSSVDQMSFPVISNPGLTRLNRLAD